MSVHLRSDGAPLVGQKNGRPSWVIIDSFCGDQSQSGPTIAPAVADTTDVAAHKKAIDVQLSRIRPD